MKTNNNKNDVFSKVIYFLNKLENHNISYTIEHNTPDAIMLIIVTPNKRYEIEFFSTGDMEVEIFESKGIIGIDESFLDKLVQENKD